MRDLTNSNVIQFNKNGMNYLQFRILNDLGIKHAYSLKTEGINFRHSGGDLVTERNSYKRLCDAVGLDVSNVTKPKQKHTNKIKRVDKVYLPEEIGEIDGLITNKQNLVLATTNADCILYLLYDRKNNAIANVHSGWKGSYQRIIENAIDEMINEFGTNPKDLIVCICPSIRKCCFEVGLDVRDMFYEKFSFLEDINKFILNGFEENKFYIDTVGINNCLLVQKGVRKENIYDSGICSMCHDDMIHSYRSEGKEFKLATAIISL
ncbi:MAG: peptidoglycan editing factor PgeF [Clostridia bacterium]|jgi:YfiH family protein|nr:peptidoglycan editing factor PgeF [Clostridia bacterium]